MTSVKPRPRGPVAEVRYSLADLMAELDAERNSSSMAMEKLDQQEIGKLFKNKTTRRAKPKK
ncbi:hypothetical protein [Opitutus sp. ER46]|uniref:hypothetical protein n=1 Tax=Opitutus sp. ER46 TaxID=2161864 RepID=UPI000D2FC162|nr:hypothetical protein [Opitutus sp. ER46]PTX94243.1 hypothetical protein DB354_10785 [Opitutus sp. ER46]